MEGTRSMGESLVRAPSGPGAARADGGALDARVLGAAGVRHLFTVNGGHIWPILAHLREHAVQMIHMRHEQSCAYAADGYARTSGQPGVLSVTAGCGLTNAVTGLCVAGLAGSAVVCIAGQHPTTEDQLGSFQEAYGAEICRTFSKFTKRVLDWSTIEVDLRLAFRAATNPPPGPALVEIPTNVLYQEGDVSRQRAGARLYPPSDLRSAGDPKLVLRQLLDGAAARGLDGARYASWRKEVAEVRSAFNRTLAEQARAARDAVPIHPARVVDELVTVMEPDATLVVDSFTLSGWLSQWFGARFAGQIVDAGPLAPVGHGIGMGIGAQLARPGKQVIVVIGDGGFGIGGMELETALKHRLPIVTLLWNNSSWGPSFDQMPMLRGRTDPFDMLPELRYDRMFEAIGCHGEHVTRPEEIRPALVRALAAGKASVINVS